MGVRMIKTLGNGARIGIWEISEDLDTLLGGIRFDEHEERQFRTFRTDQRKRQWLAYRRLLREMTGDPGLSIHYDEHGKPFLPGSDTGISISHTGNYAAVIMADHAETGIDIEMPRTRILKITEKYLHPEEASALPMDDIEVLTRYWCAKEALYKLNGRRNLDFRSQIRIISDENIGLNMKGKLLTSENEEVYEVFAERIDDLICVYVIKEKGI